MHFTKPKELRKPSRTQEPRDIRRKEVNEIHLEMFVKDVTEWHSIHCKCPSHSYSNIYVSGIWK